MNSDTVLFAAGSMPVLVLGWRAGARRAGAPGTTALCAALGAMIAADLAAGLTGPSSHAAATLVLVAAAFLVASVLETSGPPRGRRADLLFDAVILAAAATAVLAAPLGARLVSTSPLRLSGAAGASVLLIALLVLAAEPSARVTIAQRLLLAGLGARAVDEMMRATGQVVGMFSVVAGGLIVAALWQMSEPLEGDIRPEEPLARAGAARVVLLGAALSATVVGVALEDAGRSGLETAMVILAALTVVAIACTKLAMTLQERSFARGELAHRAAHDELTGLANRPLLADRLQHALGRAERGERILAVLSVDLDRFKAVNDTWGHGAGDAVLVEVANRLSLLVRPGDTVARVGGDEFVIVCEELDDVEDAIAIAERVVAAVHPPVGAAPHGVAVSVCIGIAVHRDGVSSPEALLRDAEAAMFMAKREGPNRWELYDARLREDVQRRRDTEAALQGALERDELRLVYQPVVRLATGDITGFEALVRWARPGHGLVGPDDFIGLAEESHLIIEIGGWVMEQAARQVMLWNSQHPDRAPLTISVNVSGRQFAQPGFVERLERIIRRTGVEPQSLLLEITESVLVSGADHSLALLEHVKRLGVRLAIDDFGTGYSALAYLRQFPVDIVKIDRVFMEELGRLAADTTVVAAVIRLAQVLGQEVIAEGAETAQQLAALYELGCDYVQGYYFAPPLAQAQAEMLVRSRRDLASVRLALQRA